MTRCEVCDRPVATDDQWRDLPAGERDDLCWGGIQCGSGRVDWRARAMAADEQLARSYVPQGIALEMMSFLIDTVYPGLPDVPEGKPNTLWALARDARTKVATLELDLAAARERIGELEGALEASQFWRRKEQEAAGVTETELRADRVAAMDVRDTARREAEELRAVRDDYATQIVELREAIGLGQRDGVEAARALKARAERLEALIRERQSDVMCHCDDPSGHVCWDCRARHALGEP